MIFEIARRACRQSATTDGQHDEVWRLALRQLCRNLGSNTCLPFNDVVVVKGWRHQGPLDLREFPRRIIAGVEKVSRQPDLDEFTAENPGLVDFLLRRRHRHEDHALPAEMAADISKALGMVARRRAHEQVLLGIFQQRLADEIECAADLVRPDR